MSDEISNPIVRDVRQYATYETAAGSSAVAMNAVAPEPKALNERGRAHWRAGLRVRKRC